MGGFPFVSKNFHLFQRISKNFKEFQFVSISAIALLSVPLTRSSKKNIFPPRQRLLLETRLL
jgi:hypothetical protein